LQDIRRRIATCFVTVKVTSQDVAGYYTLTATSVALNALSPEIAKKLPRYPVVPAALLGRLAVSRNYQGRGLGGILLADALKRTARAELGVFAMLVDAKDEAAQRFTSVTDSRFCPATCVVCVFRFPRHCGVWRLGHSECGWQLPLFALPPGEHRKFDPHASMRSCQAPGFVQRMAVNPARSGRKQR